MSTTTVQAGWLPRLQRWAELVRSAVRGVGVDPARDPLARSIVFLAVPMVLEMLMESVFVVVDMFFVARLGAESIAAVGFTESILALLYTLAGGLSIGVTAVVSRRVGEGDGEGAANGAAQALGLGVLLAILMGVAGLRFAPDLLRIMGAEPGVIAMGSGYARVMLGSSGIILLLFLMNAAFRGAGDAAVAMRVLWLANIVNLVLDPLLIFGIGPFPRLGVTGAAVATTIGRGLAVLAQLLILFRGSGRLAVRSRHLRLQPALMARVLRLSGTGMFQIFIATASWIGLVRILSGFGSQPLAGYTITLRIIMFVLLPAWGLANAASTMVGQALGARNPVRAERAVWLAARMNLGFLGATGTFLLIAAPMVVSWFGADATTAAYAAQSLRIVSAGFYFYAVGMVLTQAFNGAGAPWTPTIISLFCFWLGELPLAWVLARPVGLGPTGVYLAIAIAFSAVAIVASVLFRRGRWKTAVV